jgi:hypothetical protein
MSRCLPCRGSRDPRRRLVAVATCSRSAQEMLGAALHRSVPARVVRNEVVRVDGPVRPLQLAAGPQSLRLLEHVLVDSRPPHRPVGLSSAIIVEDRLSGLIAGGARRGEAPLDLLLERAGDYWTAETRAVEKVPSGDGDVSAVRLKRLLYLLGTPLAAVVEEIRLAEVCDAAGDGRLTDGALRRSA